MDKRMIVLEGGPRGGEILTVDPAMRILAMMRRPPAAAGPPDVSNDAPDPRCLYRDTDRTDAAGRRIFAVEG